MDANILRIVQSGLAIAALSLTACSAGQPPEKGTPVANALVCQHYLTQRAWVKGLVQPTVADAEQFISDVTVDAAQSTGQLHADLQTMSDDMAVGQSGPAYYAASTRVYDDCNRQ